MWCRVSCTSCLILVVIFHNTPSTTLCQPWGRLSATHILSVSGAADVSAYLISLITGAPTSQCNSTTQGASVLLVLTGTPWWWNCFTKSHKSYSGSASAASYNRQRRYQKAARPRRNSWILAVRSVAHDLKATNINCIDSSCLFHSMHWEISEYIPCLVHKADSKVWDKDVPAHHKQYIMWIDVFPLAVSPPRPRRITWPLCCGLPTMQTGHQITVKVTTKHPWGFSHTVLSKWNMSKRSKNTTQLFKKRLYWTETAAFPVKIFLPLLLLQSFIHFKYTSSHKVNRSWVSALLYFFYARSEMWCFCLCFSLKTLADPLSLIPCTLRVLTDKGIFTVKCLESVWYD